jgi:hypothetical protein
MVGLWFHLSCLVLVWLGLAWLGFSWQAWLFFARAWLIFARAWLLFARTSSLWCKGAVRINYQYQVAVVSSLSFLVSTTNGLRKIANKILTMLTERPNK